MIWAYLKFYFHSHVYVHVCACLPESQKAWHSTRHLNVWVWWFEEVWMWVWRSRPCLVEKWRSQCWQGYVPPWGSSSKSPSASNSGFAKEDIHSVSHSRLSVLSFAGLPERKSRRDFSFPSTDSALEGCCGLWFNCGCCSCPSTSAFSSSSPSLWIISVV